MAAGNLRARGTLFAGGRGNGSTPLMHTWQSVPSGAWLGYWVDQTGHCRSIPTAFRDNDGLIFVFVRGADSKLYYKSHEDWNYWGSAGSNTLYTFGRPAMELFTYYTGGSYYTDTQVFVRGYDNITYWTRYEKRYNPNTWTTWNSGLGGTSVSDPAAAKYDNGRTYVVVQGTSGYLYYRLQSDDQGNFANWAILGNAMDFR